MDTENEPSESSSEWQKTPHTNLTRYQPSRAYSARIRVEGKLIRRSLKIEQKNWAHARQGLGGERYDNPEVVEPINALLKEPYGQLWNYFYASLKLEKNERRVGFSWYMGRCRGLWKGAWRAGKSDRRRSHSAGLKRLTVGI